MIVCHKINEDSPFYNMSAADIIQDRFEIVVILEGTVESTGQTTQARSSYLNTGNWLIESKKLLLLCYFFFCRSVEILWGYRFDSVVYYNKERQGYQIDHSKFDATIQVDTPLCSAKELSDYYRIQEDYKNIQGKYKNNYYTF